MRLSAVVLAITLAASASAWAQGDAGSALRRACRADYQARCAARGATTPAMAACLAQHYVSLSAACRQALDAYAAGGSVTTDD